MISILFKDFIYYMSSMKMGLLWDPVVAKVIIIIIIIKSTKYVLDKVKKVRNLRQNCNSVIQNSNRRRKMVEYTASATYMIK